jgi:molybdenum cofactor guanylyltransferase
MTTEIFVLAGGKSSRMGHDKAQVPWQGKPLLEHVLEAAKPLGLPISLIAHNSWYAQWGLPVFTDVIPDKGPMGGLFTALSHANTEGVLLLTCDMPLITTPMLSELLSGENPPLCRMYQQGDRIFPFPGWYPRHLCEKVHGDLLQNKLKMINFIQETQPLLLSLKEDWEANMKNINSPGDVSNLEKTWQK